TLFAKWANKVIVYVKGTLEGNVTVFVGEGDVLVEKLPAYVARETRTEDGKQYFAGWYIIVDGEETSLDGTETIAQEDSGIIVFAKWEDVPVWAGTYYGTELWSKNSGNGSMYYVTIDLDGKVTSKISSLNGATITSYDAATQQLKCRCSNGKERIIFFDAVTGIIAADYYGSNNIGHDYYIMSKALTSSNYKVVANFGVNATQPGSSARNYYLQFVTLETVRATETLVLYNNHIYSNATIQSATGETLATPSDVANSKTVVVKDNGTILAKVASVGSSLTANTTTVDLDEFFGTYTSEGKSDLSLDGAGSFVWGAKVGTYTLVSNEENILFDIYVVANGENTEYYKLTIIGNSYVEEKPMSYVTYQMVAPQGATLPDSIERVYVNTNIAISLPNGADINTAFVFNGFFADAECTQAIDGEFTPTAANNVIYVKYSNPAILTKVFNDGTTANEEIRYSVGDQVTIALPTWEKHALVGWFLQDGTETGEWGEQWIDGTAITANTTVYAKWEAAPVFNQTYGTIWINKTTNGFGTNSSADKRGNPFTFDPYGNYDLKGSFPLNNYATQLVEFDKVNGTIKVLSNVSNSNFYGGRDAFIDVETGLIIVNYKVDNADWSSVFAFVPGGTSQLSSYSESYWNGGKSKAVSFSVGEVDYAILISGSQVYIGTHFVDQTGATVNGEKAIESTTISVKKGENVVATVHPCFTLTLVYGNGIKTETKSVLPGGFDMADYQPEYKNGQMLTGWYTTPTFDVGTEFNPATANSDVTVYGKWEDHDPYVLSSTGSYAWTETDGVWSSGNQGKGSTTSELKLTALADMIVTVSAGASGEKNYDYLYISVNGTKQYDKIGDATKTISFKTYTFKLKANDVVTFSFKKDGSGNKELDTAQVKDVAVELIVPITLTYNFNIAEKENVVKNMKSHDVVEELLAVTESVGTKVFAGWYTTAECADGTEFTVGTELTVSTQVFAKWLEKATLTIVYGNGLANFDWDLVPGETFNLAEKIPS
ncbi:MAG: InlB B-repeat-containing protein, partial [Candidatus Fimimonas sp.]